jgi:hypothetical protein
VSYSTLFVVKPGGDLQADGELRNSWGSAVRIWESVYRRYMDPKPRFSYSPHETIESSMMLKGEDQRRFWNLAGDPALPLFARRVFEFTFDKIVVPRDECAVLADAIAEFDAALPAPAGTVNHLPALAEWLRKCAAREDIEGVCVNWTSVEDVFDSQPIDPNDDDTEYRGYNIYTDGAHRMRTFVEPVPALAIRGDAQVRK